MPRNIRYETFLCADNRIIEEFRRVAHRDSQRRNAVVDGTLGVIGGVLALVE